MTRLFKLSRASKDWHREQKRVERCLHLNDLSVYVLVPLWTLCAYLIIGYGGSRLVDLLNKLFT